jgi:hypothetical protein
MKKIYLPLIEENSFRFNFASSYKKILLIRIKDNFNYLSEKNLLVNIVLHYYWQKYNIDACVLSLHWECFENFKKNIINFIKFPYGHSPDFELTFFSSSDEYPNCSENNAVLNLSQKISIKTKKGDPLQSKNLKFEKCTSLFLSEKIKPNFFVEEIKNFKIGIVKFSGFYGIGSNGSDEAFFINFMMDLFCAYENLDGMIVDLSDLDYEWGDDLSISTYKFYEIDSPIITIAKKNQLEALRNNGIECFDIEISQAIKNLEKFLMDK